jgi:hypothetical protein
MRFLFILILCLLSGFTFAQDSNKVARELTPIGKPELAAVLRDGHYAVFGYFPSDERLAVAWAQVAIENRQGLEVYNHNLGNITSGKNRPYYVKHNRFRAHKTFSDGAIDYWNVVKKLCRSSFKHFDKGEPYQAAQVLKRCGYYGADSDKYGKAMVWLYNHARGQVLPKL